MLEVRGLIKRYNRIPAVDGVSFTIRPGEILGYIGPNGAGKSTTVKVLTGLIEPTDGEIFFNGRDVREDWIGFQRRMGYVPEEPHLYPHLTGREYLQLVGRLRGLPRSVLEDRKSTRLNSSHSSISYAVFCLKKKKKKNKRLQINYLSSLLLSCYT